ncbi:MAG TPA: hypothetical protein PLW14_01000 [Chlorobiota bacterium]|nr:hypothetical protein [Chlorobiota bacterium]
MNIRNLILLAVVTVGVTVDVSAQWIKGAGIPDSMSIIRSVVRGENGVLVANSWGDGVFMSTDDGVSWTSHVAGLPRVGGQYVTVNTAAVHNGNVYIGTVLRGIWRYDTSVGEWKHLRGFDSTTIHSMVVHNDVVYAGCFRSGIVRIVQTDKVESEYVPAFGDGLTVIQLVSAHGKLFVGTNRDGWNIYDPDANVLSDDNRGFLTERPFGVWPRAFAADGSSLTAVLGDNLMGGGVYARSSDTDEWQRYEDGFPLVFQTIFGAAAVGTTYFVSTGYFGGQGVYVRTRGQQQWSPWNEGLPNLDIEGVVAWRRQSDTVRVVVASRQIGLWYRDTIVPTTSVYEPIVRPERKVPTFTVHRNDVPIIIAREGLCYLYDLAGRRFAPDAVGTGVFLGGCSSHPRTVLLIVQ